MFNHANTIYENSSHHATNAYRVFSAAYSLLSEARATLNTIQINEQMLYKTHGNTGLGSSQVNQSIDVDYDLEQQYELAAQPSAPLALRNSAVLAIADTAALALPNNENGLTGLEYYSHNAAWSHNVSSVSLVQASSGSITQMIIYHKGAANSSNPTVPSSTFSLPHGFQSLRFDTAESAPLILEDNSDQSSTITDYNPVVSVNGETSTSVIEQFTAENESGFFNSDRRGECGLFADYELFRLQRCGWTDSYLLWYKRRRRCDGRQRNLRHADGRNRKRR